MAEKFKVRTTQRPDEEVEVEKSEYEFLKLYGLLVADDKVDAAVQKDHEQTAQRKADSPVAVEARPDNGPAEIQAARGRKDV